MKYALKTDLENLHAESLKLLKEKTEVRFNFCMFGILPDDIANRVSMFFCGYQKQYLTLLLM